MLFACDASQISKAVDYVRDELRKRRIRSEGVTRAMLAAEEILNAMIRHAPSAEESVNVRVVSLMHNTSVRITCREPRSSASPSSCRSSGSRRKRSASSWASIRWWA